jgi:hypothetical protein
MSRKFNGTSDRGQIAVNLSAFSALSISFWMWWDANGNGNNIALEYGTTTSVAGGWGLIPNQGSGVWTFGMGIASGGLWYDALPARPTAAAWHHFLLTSNRATPVNTAFVDGVSKTLSTVTHTAGTYGNYGNLTLNVMSRNAASLFGAGRMAELTIWGGVLLGQAQATALAAGAHPLKVHPDNVALYTPFLGDPSPEPDYSGGRHGCTLNGTTVLPHPRVQAFMQLFGRSSYSG